MHDNDLMLQKPINLAKEKLFLCLVFSSK